jgi:hypothetical protein
MKKTHIEKIGWAYLIAAMLCALFGAVYEMFSHEVYSGFMVFAFAIPLLGGAAPFLALARLHSIRLPDQTTCRMYHCGLATLTVGCIMEGVLAIYGTTNDLSIVYWVAGPLLVVTGLLKYALGSTVLMVE